MPRKNSDMNMPKGWILYVPLEGITWNQLAQACDVAQQLDLLDQEVEFDTDENDRIVYIAIEQP